MSEFKPDPGRAVSSPVTLPPGLAAVMAGRTVWHVNTTATGGGVAELLDSSVRLHNDSGIRARWLVLNGEAEFFTVTKRLHHRLHGGVDEVGSLGEVERKLYETTTRRQAEEVANWVGVDDICVLHDPQTLGLAPHLAARGLRVAWRCHIGTSVASGIVDETWQFLRPYLRTPEVCGFSVAEYAPPQLRQEDGKVLVLRPSIDPASRKNRPLAAPAVHELLRAIGLEPPTDGRPTRNTRGARVLQDDHLPPDAPMVIQVSRWDPLKDMAGVLEGFATYVAPVRADAHLVLAGPDPADIPDDPEGAQILHRLREAWQGLPPSTRRRVHVVTLSLTDTDTNAQVVNALQQRADVVLQKSLREGFGLTVTEAMWKGKAIVASAVGGIPAQIRDGIEGLLIRNPHDFQTFGRAVVQLLEDPALRNKMGEAARRRCASQFLIDREFLDYCTLYRRILSGHRIMEQP
ncbi:glycosyltransferase [Streptomyces viridochromogenes]|uniref:glycosyltransferase n=1 Tax=Streptomyces viridochromogenes TaxID=1938 RepID=UPI00133177F2|nr:glycosyltransferase [Streptomyces viridochromogenes]